MVKTLKKLCIGFIFVMAALFLSKKEVHAAGENVVMEGSCGENATYTLTGDESTGYHLSISGTGEMYSNSPWEEYEEKVVSVDIKGVTTIGRYAFEDCISLTEVTIPNSVTTIGDGAFRSCTSLKEITIPGSVTTIDVSAFARCSSLVEITIPNSETTIGESAFYDTNLKNVLIPESVKEIGDQAFGYRLDAWGSTYDKMDGFSISGYDNSVAELYAKKNGFEFTSIGSTEPMKGKCGENASYTVSWDENGYCTLVISGTGKMDNYDWNGAPWYGVRDYTDEINIVGVSYIGDRSFYGCSAQKVTIDSSVEEIGGWAFAYCRSLTEITIPNSVTTIGLGAFCSCTSLAKVYNSNAIATIGEYVFSCCTSLVEITIPNSATTIDLCAFGGCTSLTEIMIPNSVTSISITAFDDCTSLSKIKGYTGTVAETYAKEKGIAFIALDQTTLATPVLGTVNSTSTGVSVSWNAVEGAERYKVFRKVSGGNWVTVGTTTGTSIIDTKAVDGTTYTYTVACVNEAGKNVSGFDKTGKTITFKKPTSMLETPVLGEVSSTATGVKITWGAVNGAERYKVFRKVSGGSWVTVGTTTGTSIIDTKAVDGTTYTYTVACVNEAGKNVSGFDKTGKTVTYKKPTDMLATPVLGTVSSTSTGVSVSWSAVEGAERYKVFRKVAGGNWVTVGTTTVTSIIDTKAIDGTTYTYTVACVNEAGKNVSGFDKTGKTITFKKPTGVLATPVLGEVSSTATGVKITWGAVNGAERYKVFRKVAGENWVTVGTTTGTSIIDTKAVDGTTYTYTVACVNEAGKNVSGFDKAGKTITYKKPTSMLGTPVLGTVSSTSTGVSVSWSAVEGAERYKVFRKMAGENWVTVGTTTGTSIIDTKAVKGITYIYTVRCISADGKTNTSDFDHTGLTITY